MLERLGDLGVRRAATVVQGGTPYDQVDLTGPVALVLGSEAHGLAASALEAVDERLTIPMEGRSESLNVAMAGSIALLRVAPSAPSRPMSERRTFRFTLPTDASDRRPGAEPIGEPRS